MYIHLPIRSFVYSLTLALLATSMSCSKKEQETHSPEILLLDADGGVVAGMQDSDTSDLVLDAGITVHYSLEFKDSSGIREVFLQMEGGRFVLEGDSTPYTSHHRVWTEPDISGNIILKFSITPETGTSILNVRAVNVNGHTTILNPVRFTGKAGISKFCPPGSGSCLLDLSQNIRCEGITGFPPDCWGDCANSDEAEACYSSGKSVPMDDPASASVIQRVRVRFGDNITERGIRVKHPEQDYFTLLDENWSERWDGLKFGGDYQIQWQAGNIELPADVKLEFEFRQK